jgi:hypothetical protein
MSDIKTETVHHLALDEVAACQDELETIKASFHQAVEVTHGLVKDLGALRKRERSLILEAMKWAIENRLHREGPYWEHDFSIKAYTDETLVAEFLKSKGI